MSEHTSPENDKPAQDSSNSLPPAGWYNDPAADPSQAATERYWDGASWTQATRAKGSDVAQAGSDQHATASGVVAYSGSAQPQDAPQGGYSQSASTQIQFEGNNVVGLNAPSTPDGVPLASWGKRFLGLVIDCVIMGVVGSILVSIAFALHPETEIISQVMNDDNPELAIEAVLSIATSPIFIAMSWLGVAIQFLYGLLLLRFKAGTVGMMAVGIRVVPDGRGRDHAQLGWKEALIRQVVFILLGQLGSIFGGSLLIGFLAYLLYIANGLAPLFTAKRQTFHDMLAQTQVVRIR